MSRNYVCGVIRDPIKRFLTVQFPLAEGRKITSVSAESWVGQYDTPIRALTTEIRLCLGISNLDIFDIKTTRVLTTFFEDLTKTITVIIMDIREATTFKLGEDVSNILFLPWDHLTNAVNSKQIVPTIYSKCIVDRLYSFKDVV